MAAQIEGDYTLQIQHCTNCSSHQWCTRHVQSKYEKAFQECKQHIEALGPGVRVLGNITAKPPIGAFEIRHDNNLLFSKIIQGIFPSPALVAERIREYLQTLQTHNRIDAFIVVPPLSSEQQQQKQQILQQQRAGVKMPFHIQNDEKKILGLLNGGGNLRNVSSAAGERQRHNSSQHGPYSVYRTTAKNAFSNTKRSNAAYQKPHVSFDKVSKNKRSNSTHKNFESNLRNTWKEHSPSHPYRSDIAKQQDLRILQNTHPAIYTQSASLYERLGGEEFLRGALENFHERAQHDSTVKEFFAEIDMNHHRKQQLEFLAGSLGAKYGKDGLQIKNAYAQLTFSEEHRRVISALIVATLSHYQQDPALISESLQVLEQLPTDELSANTTQNLSLFERLGGDKFLNSATEIFYQKVNQNDIARGFFVQIDEKYTRQQQKDLIIQALTAQENYQTPQVNFIDSFKSYMEQNITVKTYTHVFQLLEDERVFKAIQNILQGTLTQLKADSTNASEVVQLFESFRPDQAAQQQPTKEAQQVDIHDGAKDQKQQQKTILESIGGQETANQIVDKFYEKALKDERIKSFYEEVEKKSNLQAQKELFTAVLGHTNGVSPDVIEVQKHFEIKIEQFQASAEVLQQVLVDLHIEVGLAKSIQDLFEPLKQQLLTVAQ